MSLLNFVHRRIEGGGVKARARRGQTSASKHPGAITSESKTFTGEEPEF